MDLLWWALLLSGGIYFAGVLWLWKGLGLPRPEMVEALPSVSVIVAARDEQEALPGCLQALQGQDYQGPFEVVVVDDRSGAKLLGLHLLAGKERVNHSSLGGGGEHLEGETEAKLG